MPERMRPEVSGRDDRRVPVRSLHGSTHAKEQIMNDEIEVLRQRVKELEDTVLYLSNTLALHGIFSPAEASTAQRMHENAAWIGWGQQ